MRNKGSSSSKQLGQTQKFLKRVAMIESDGHFSHQYGVAVRVRLDGVVLVYKYHLLANDSPSGEINFNMLVK